LNEKIIPEEAMNMNRRTAIIAGVLYIIGTVAGILSVVFTQPVANAKDYLAAVAAYENQVIFGALFILTMGLALAMVPVVLFPLLKKFNEVLALSYVVFRGTLETVTYLAIAVCWLLMPLLAQRYAETPDAFAFQNLGSILLQIQDAVNLILIIIFSMGALILYYLLYTSRLIPRWISVWGFIAILLHLSTSFLDMFGFMTVSMSGATFVLNFPIFLQEMVMAVWLIVKGFNISAFATESS
jgi:hypothetical protein